MTAVAIYSSSDRWKRIVLPMSRFFFHLHDEAGVVLDPEGEEFTGLDAARMKALVITSQIIIDDLKRTGTVRRGYFEIMDATGQVLATVPFLKMHGPAPHSLG